MEKEYFLLTAGGVDRKGIIYNLSKVLAGYGFNLEDSSMLMLRRTFSVIVLLSHNAGRAAGLSPKFRAELKKFANKYSMVVDIQHISEKEMEEYSPEGNSYMISINGADKPGIVEAITGVLNRSGVNVIDMETKSSQHTSPPAYYMFLETDVPSKVNIRELKKALAATGKKIGVHVTVTKIESDVL
jgi:glycine cleavage system transcriptional repressor